MATRFAPLCQVLLLAIHCLLASAQAAERTVYRIGVEDIDYFPIQNFTSQNRTGFLPALLEQFSEETGVIFEFVPLPLHRIGSWYEEGRIDLKIPDNAKWSVVKSPGVYFSQPILTFCEETIVLKEHAQYQADDIQRIGTLNGFTPSPEWQARISRGKVELVRDPSIKVLTRMLMHGMVDGLDVSIDAVKHQLKTFDLDESEVAVARHIPSGNLAYRMSSVSHPEVIAQFDEFLVKYQDYIRQLVQSYNIQQLPDCPQLFLQSGQSAGSE